MAKRRTLTPKQRAFVGAYVETGNGAEAVRRAGYATKRPDKKADELRGIEGVNAAIERLRKGIEARTEITKAAVMDIVWDIARGDGVEKRDRLTACRDLSKMMGYNEPEQHDVNFTGAADKLRKRIGTMLDRVNDALKDP